MKLTMIDLLGDLLGKLRRRRLEQRARKEAQALLDQAKPQLIALAVQAVDKMPAGRLGGDLARIAHAALTGALTEAVAKGALPQSAADAVIIPTADALRKLLPMTSLSVFQPAAKGVVSAAIQGLKL